MTIKFEFHCNCLLRVPPKGFSQDEIKGGLLVKLKSLNGLFIHKQHDILDLWGMAEQ